MSLLSPEEEGVVDAGFRELATIAEDQPGPYRLLHLEGVGTALGMPDFFGPIHYSVRPASPEEQARAPQPRLSYVFGMTADFVKSIRKYDKATLGRVLVAISELSQDPTTIKGDTVKPLAGDMRGLWRYRVGDFRLLYRPDADNRRILLLAFSPRAAAYD